MEQAWAIKRMISTLKKDPDIPSECLEHIQYALELMWQVGWEHRNKELGQHHLKPIKQLDRDGHIVQVYPSLKDAAIVVGYIYKSLQRAVRRGSYTHYRQYKWEYVEKLVEGIGEIEQQDGLLNTEVISNSKVNILPRSHP
jgi:hypothetical protein